MRRVYLKEAGFDWHRIEAVDGLPAKIVTADAAENCGTVAETASHHGEVGRRATQARGIRQDIPEQFADAENRDEVLSLLRSYPSVDGTILPSGRCVFRAGLALENCSVGDGVGVRTANLAVKQPLESRLAPSTFSCSLFTYRISSCSGSFGKSAAPGAQKAPQHRRAKGIEEKHHARSGRDGEICGVAAKHAHGCACAIGGAPKRKIPACDARQGGMQLNADDGAKRIIGGEEHCASHAGAEIDECVRVDRREGPASAPTHEDALKDGGRDRVVGRDVPIVTVARAKVAPRNQAAGAHAKLQVEGVANQSIFLRQPGQAGVLRYARFRFHFAWRAHA